MSEVVLHQWVISPFCGKVRKVLELKGISYQTREYNGLKAARAASLTPVGKLPVLDYGGARIADSSAIVRFLEESHPQPNLWPDDPVNRSFIHIWEDWADESLYWFEVYFRFCYREAMAKAVNLLCYQRPAFEKVLFRWIAVPKMRKSLRAQGLGKMDHKQVEAAFHIHLRSLDSILSERKWLVGSQISIADLAVSAQLEEIIRTSHLADKILLYPGLAQWLKRNGCPHLAGGESPNQPG